MVENQTEKQWIRKCTVGVVGASLGSRVCVGRECKNET